MTAELAEIEACAAREAAMGEPRWSELCFGTMLVLVALGSTLQVLQQLCGMNVFMLYGPSIFGGITGTAGPDAAFLFT